MLNPDLAAAADALERWKMSEQALRPTLHAFLFCRGVRRDTRGITHLERPFAKLLLPFNTALPFQHNFVVYHHWGGGRGTFIERFEVIGPLGTSVLSHPEGIRLTDLHDSYDVLIDCRVLVNALGDYRCNVFLDGELAGERLLPIVFR